MGVIMMAVVMTVPVGVNDRTVDMLVLVSFAGEAKKAETHQRRSSQGDDAKGIDARNPGCQSTPERRRGK